MSGSSARPAMPPTSSSGSTSTRTARSTWSTPCRRRSRGALPAGYEVQLTGLRPDPGGIGAPVRGGPHPRRDGLAADRGARPDPGLRIADRGRHAAARRRAGDPDLGRDHQPGRAADRDEHLRPEHRDDARAGARDRLLAVPDQSIPRGAQARPERRAGGGASRGHGRQGGAVLRDRRRRSACPGCCGSRRPGCRRSGWAGRSSSSRRCSTASSSCRRSSGCWAIG